MNKLIIILAVYLVGCAATVKQDLSKSIQLSPGMSKEEVVNIMGPPVRNEFDRNVEEFHYCSTGMHGGDDYLALFFHNNKLITMKSYTVTLSDAGSYGSCEKFIKRGTYQVPDQVLEIRLKN